jgi:uncharacterized membrane protein
VGLVVVAVVVGGSPAWVMGMVVMAIVVMMLVCLMMITPQNGG